MHHFVRAALIATCLLAIAVACPASHARDAGPSITIPQHVEGQTRAVTTDDLARLRDIDSLSISRDGRRFAILVRQAVPERNTYRTAFFIGSLQGGALTYAGHAGEARLLTRPNGAQTGDFGGSVSRWSPDGRFIAYMVAREGEVQLWVSRADGRGQRQVTHNGSDVRDFAWSEDANALYFKVGTTRAELAVRAEARARSGYRMQEFDTLFRALNPGRPSLPLETDLAIWRVGVNGRGERLATPAESAAFEVAAAQQTEYRPGGVEVDTRRISAALRPPIRHRDGALAWLERVDPSQDGAAPFARLVARLNEAASPIACTHPSCGGQIFRKIWWSEDGAEILFWRLGGTTDRTNSLFAWRPTTGAVRTIVSAADHVLSDCDLANLAIVCLRETPLEPRHVAHFAIADGALRIIGNVNPEMARLRLGRVEHIEWDSDRKAEDFGYAPRAHGFILYPPDYDPRRSYPLFIAPYAAGGFLRGDVGDEHPLLVYAANGFVVLNSAFPGHTRFLARSEPVALVNRTYSPQLGYPHLSIYSGSTFRGLALAMTRAHIDPARIGIGGVSHGAFVPLLMMQHQDRFAALSVAGGSWSQSEYYFARLPEPFGERAATIFPEDAAFWAPLDLAQHVETIEAPVLFHMADRELTGAGPLIRRMTDARLAVEAYSFPNERHLKSQSAHRLAIYNRNLDWFRFWLQDIEDPDPAKAEQYERWRRLRGLQCRNTRSLRNYCSVVSTMAPPR